MKQKIFGAIALSAAFVACTNDADLVPSIGSDAQLSGRAKLGEVELSTTSATRAIVKDGEDEWNELVFLKNEAIGAALVDELNEESVKGTIKNWTDQEWTYAQYVTGYEKEVGGEVENAGKKTLEQAGGNPHGFFDVVSNTIYTNYGYTYNGEAWKTEASLVEGHYMFYFPFNINNSSRQPVDVQVPVTQNCTDGNSAIDDFYAGTSPIAVDVKFLKKPAAGQKMSVKANLQHLYAYPQITIKNDFNGFIFNMKKTDDGQDINTAESKKSTTAATVKKTMTIDKIELYYTGDDQKLWHTGTLNAVELDNRINDNEGVKKNWASSVNPFETASHTSEVVENEKANFTTNLKPYLAKNDDQFNTVPVYSCKQTITCNINKTLENGQEYVFNAIMPAEDYGKDKLKARVYVTIEGHQYVLLAAINTPVHQDDDSEKPILCYTNTSVTGTYTMAAGKNIELVRNQRYPIIEYKVADDGETSVKATAGNMMTISMNGLHAFEVGTFQKDKIDEKYRGFSNEDEFVAHMQDATRGTTLTEIKSLVGAGESNSLDEHEIAFKPNHTVVLNAKLVNKIFKNVNYNSGPTVHMHLEYSNLPIADDVTVTKKDENKYELTATTDEKSTIIVTYGNSVINKDGGSLKSGINEISENVELKGSGTGVVYLNSGKITVKDGANCFRVTVKADVTLKVNGACNALLDVKKGATIEIGENGSLTNANSTFEAATDLNDGNYISITNKYLKQIAANVQNNPVTADFEAWPTSVTSASKVNKVVINPTNPIAITVDQAGFSVFQNANTYVELGTNVTAIRSTADVNLTTIGNLKQIKGSCAWNASTGTIIITAYKYKNDSNPVQISGLNEGTGVTFNEIDRP